MNFKDIKQYISSDTYRYLGNFRLKNILNLYFRNRFFRYIFWFRCSKSSNYLLSSFAKIMKSGLSKKTGIQISSSVKIGYGLYIPHGYVVINGTAEIGDNCNICQFTTIGSVKKSAATLGDNVYISPNVCIVENISIESNVVIGSGSVILKNIPEGTVVAGVPGRKLNSTIEINDYIKNPYEI